MLLSLEQILDMEKVVIQDNEFVETSFVLEYKLAHVMWKKKNITSQIYRDAWTKILDYSEKMELKNFLSDGRLQGVISTKDRKWFMDVAVKRAVENGLIRAVVINKKDPFRKYYLNTILKYITRKSPVEMKIFFDYDEGLEWLLSFKEHLK